MHVFIKIAQGDILETLRESLSITLTMWMLLIAWQAGLLLSALQVNGVFKSANLFITEYHTLNSYFSALGEKSIAIPLQ